MNLTDTVKTRADQFKQSLERRFKPLVVNITVSPNVGSVGVSLNVMLHPKNPKPISKMINFSVIVTDYDKNMGYYFDEMVFRINKALIEQGIESMR